MTPQGLSDESWFCAPGAGHGARSWGQFAADIAALRPQIEGAERVCNLVGERYQFMVGLAAALLNGQTTVLPASRAVGSVRLALGEPKGAVLLGSCDVPQLAERHVHSIAEGKATAPSEDLRAALTDATGRIEVYTSGSTGMPVAHHKAWATMTGGARLSAEIFAQAGLARGEFAIIGTTPHQHMYGLEAAVFTGLSFGHCLHRAKVFYPEDLIAAVRQAEGAAAEAIALVSSPVHLKYLEPAIAELPQIRLVLSATAPLPFALAERLEARGDLPVFEIYGSTETGSLGWRRTIEGDDWQAAGGFRLSGRSGAWIASAPHLPHEVALSDELELLPDGRFRLLGRLGDMVNVAGKRTSLGALNTVLVEAPGVADAVMLRTATEAGDQLSIIAVRDPGLAMSDDACRSAIRRHLQAHVDPVFVPRRIAFVAALPRSETGKISAGDMARLASLAG